MMDYRDYLFDLVEELDAASVRKLAQSLIYWMSIDDAEHFCRVNDLLIEEDEEEEE